MAERSPARALPLLLGGTTLVQTLVTLASLAIATLAPAVAASLEVSPALVGHQMSLIYAAAALSATASGSLVRRFGACRASQLALVLGALGCAVAAAGHLALIGLASLLIGLGYGMTNPASSHVLHRFTPEGRRNLIFSLKQTGVPLGGVAAGLLLPPLSLSLSWPAALLLTAAAAFAIAALLQPLRPAWDDDRRPGAPLGGQVLDGLRVVFRNPPIRRLALTAFCFAAVQLCLTTFVVTLLVEDLGRSLVAAGGIAAAVQVVGALGRVAWGWLADRLANGLLVLVIVGLISAGCSLATAALGPAWPGAAVIALLSVFGLAAIGWNGVFLAEVARLAPARDVGTATGGALFFTFSGVVVGPSLFAAAVGAAGGYAAAFPVLAGFALVGVALLLRTLVAAPHRRRA